MLFGWPNAGVDNVTVAAVKSEAAIMREVLKTLAYNKQSLLFELILHLYLGMSIESRVPVTWEATGMGMVALCP